MYREYSSKLDEDDRNSDDAGDDRDAIEGDRIERYVGETSDIFKSKSLNDLKPFYNGSSLDSRMAEIRKSIYHIRLHWEEFDNFLSSLKNVLAETGELDFEDESLREHIDRLFSVKRDWLKGDDVDKDVTYDAIQLYTSKVGYNAIYSLCNRIFRQEDATSSVDIIRSAVFLVELINIDLYNYCLLTPEKRNFEGVVYRGLVPTEEDIKAFRALRSCPIGKRNIAVPLGLSSSSSSKKKARTFIKGQLKQQQSNNKLGKPLLMKIHVIGLKPEYIDHYTTTFPTTVLTTICAVDIRQLSCFPGEREVLLRGPFYQILDMYVEENCINGGPCEVIEAVMLNANRDHISTSFLGDQDGPAREMFGTMVAVTRSEFGLKYCTEKGLLDDAEEYGKILQESKEKLDRIMGRK